MIPTYSKYRRSTYKPSRNFESAKMTTYADIMAAGKIESAASGPMMNSSHGTSYQDNPPNKSHPSQEQDNFVSTSKPSTPTNQELTPLVPTNPTVNLPIIK